MPSGSPPASQWGHERQLLHQALDQCKFVFGEGRELSIVESLLSAHGCESTRFVGVGVRISRSGGSTRPPLPRLTVSTVLMCRRHPIPGWRRGRRSMAGTLTP